MEKEILIAPIPISVVICTHNPIITNIIRCIQSLQNQDFTNSDWELIIIDNASEQFPDLGKYLDWKTNLKIVKEPKVGLTWARLKGIESSSGDLILFVDDDNLLDPDYLKNAHAIHRDFPQLGAWGGANRAEFEELPGPEVEKYIGYLAVHEVASARWSNQPFNYQTTPCGAGMCVRSEVAKRYAADVLESPSKVEFDRKGSEIYSCGDHDMAYTACDLGLGTGVFPELKLVHIIPANRVSKAYILKLLEGDAFSSTMLKIQRGHPGPAPKRRYRKFDEWREVGRAIRRALRKKPAAIKTFDQEVDDAVYRGIQRANSKIFVQNR